MAEELPIGSLAVETVASTERIRRQVQQEIPRLAERGGTAAARAFSQAFGKGAEKGGEDAGLKAVRAIGRQFDVELARAKIDLSQRVLNPEQFEQEVDRLSAITRQKLLAVTEVFDDPALSKQATIALASQLDRVGQDAGVVLARRLREQFLGTMAKSKEQLARGTIDRRAFRQQAKLASEDFRNSLLRSISTLSKKGLLTQRGRTALTKQLEGVGREGGALMGSALRAGLRPGLGKVAGLIRVNLAAAIAVAGVIATRKLIQIGREAVRALGSIIERAGRADAIRRGFEELTSGAGLDAIRTLELLRRAAAGTASDFDLMTQANFALQAGLPLTEEGLANLLNLARRLGKTLGRDAVESFRRLTNGIAKNERRILDELGIIVDFENEHRKLARTLDKNVSTLTAQEKVQANLNAVLREGERILASLGVEELTAVDRLNQLRSAARNVRDALALGVTEAPKFEQALADLGDQALDTSEKLDTIRVTTAALVDTILEFATDRTFTTFLGLLATGPAAFADALLQIGGGEPVFLKLLANATGINEQFQQTADLLKEEAGLRREIIRLQGLDNEEDIQKAQREIFEDNQRLRKERAEGLIDENEFLEEQEKLLKKVEAVERALFRLRRGGSGGEEDDPDTKRIERLREQLAKLRQDAELAQEFGFPAIEAAPPRLRAILQQIKASITAQAALNKLLTELGIQPTGALATYLEHLEDLEAQLRAQAQVIADNPDLLLTQSAQEARDKLKELSAEFRILQSLGVTDLLTQIPDVLLAAARETAAATKQLETAEEALEELGEAATKDERAFVKAQRVKVRELERVKAELVGVQDILELFPGIELDFLTSLDEEQLRAFTSAMERLAFVTEKVNEARAQLELNRRLGLETTEQEARLNLLLKAQANILRLIAELLRQAGFATEDLVAAIDALAGATEDTAEATSFWMQTLDDAERIARGVLRIADAFGDLDDDIRKSLEGAVELFSGLRNLRKEVDGISKLNIPGVIQAVGGGLALVSGLAGIIFGPGETEKQRDKLIEALDRLRNSLEDAAKGILGLPGRVSSAITRVFEGVAFVTGGNITEITRDGVAQELVRDPQEIVRRLQAAGVTGADIRELGRRAGVDLNDLANALDGVAFHADRVSDEIKFLQEAIDLEILKRFFDTIEGRMEILDRKTRILDLTTEETLDGTLKLLEESGLALTGDITTAAGRQSLEDQIEAGFLAAMTDPATLLALAGDLPPEVFLELLERAEALLDELAEEAGDEATSAGVFRGASIEQFDRFIGIAQTQLFFLEDIARSARSIAGREDLAPLPFGVPVTPVPTPISAPGQTPPVPTPPLIPAGPGLQSPVQLNVNIDGIGPFEFPGITDGRAAVLAASSLSGAEVVRVTEDEVRRKLLFRGIPS